MQKRLFASSILVIVTATIAMLALGSTTSAAPVLQGDIVFVIDESGSMGDDIADVSANVGSIAAGFSAAGIDAQFALVGFGTGSGASHPPSDGSPHTHTNMTSAAGLSAALAGLDASGSFEPGVEATIHAMNNVTGYRDGAGVCVVLITDEDSDGGDLATANAALNARNATWFGVVDPNGSGFPGNIAAVYGPDAGSMSEYTGGAIFDLLAFRADPAPVLGAVVAACAESIAFDIDIKPGSDPNSINSSSHGVVPVALLGSDVLDVNDVDVSTLAFGVCGAETAAPVHNLSDPAVGTKHVEDVNGDGFMDLVSHYRQSETGLSPGDTDACLTATVAGKNMSGTDSVNIVR